MIVSAELVHGCGLAASLKGQPMPSEEDYFSKAVGGYLKKYLAGPATLAVDDRVRCFRLVEDMTASKFAGLLMVARVHGGGSPEAERLAVYRSYDLESRKTIAKRAAGIR